PPLPEAEVERIAESVSRYAHEKPTIAQQQECPRHFEQRGEGRYCLELPSIGVSFEIDRLRRERNELIGELCVRCALPGAHTFDGTLSTADFNISSARSRTERAKFLEARSRASDLVWVDLIEEFCQRVLTAERAGQPAIDLRDLERPGPLDTICIE